MKNNEILDFMNKLLKKESRIIDVLIETQRVFNLSDGEIIGYIDIKLMKQLKKQEIENGTILKKECKIQK